MTAPDKPVPPVVHLGLIARELREMSTTRMAFAEAVGLSMTDLRRWEEGRMVLGTEALQRILRHPAMADLHRRAVEAGIEPTVSPGPGDKGGGGGEVDS